MRPNWRGNSKEVRVEEIQEVMSAGEYQEWKQHPTTVKVLRLLTSLRDQYQAQLLRGSTLNRSSVEITALQTCELWGTLSGLNQILDLRVVDNKENSIEEEK
jgi:hypothetical protein